jgi:phosphohistidine phosphatase
MKILIIRHGIAQEREDFDLPNDDLRPLTSEGKKEFEKVSKYYKKLYPNIEDFFSSPLVRAIQTADILKKKFTKKYTIIEELRPECTPHELLKKLESTKKSFIAIIGHEPLLSQFIGYAVSGRNESIVDLKKGGACLIEVGEKSKIMILHSPRSLLKLKLS